MPYNFARTELNSNVAEQQYATAWRVRMSNMTSCICVAGRHTFGKVVGVHLVVVGADGTFFDDAAAGEVARIMAHCWQVVIAGHLDCWDGVVPAFQTLRGGVNPQLVDLSGGPIHGLEFRTRNRRLGYRVDGGAFAPCH